MAPSRTRHADAVVIGSGLGGTLAALRLSEAGARTILLERGRWPRRDRTDWNPDAILSELRYRGPQPLKVRQGGARRFRDLAQNETVGGMSVFYGAASLRLRPADFARWPISYEDLEPWYDEAERVLGVHGTDGADPLEPPRLAPYPYRSVPYAAPAERIRDAGERLGLRPFPIPLAIDFAGWNGAPCVLCNTCDGFPCAIEAKNDAAGLLRRAGRSRRLDVRSGIRVWRLRFARDRVVAADATSGDSGQGLSFAAPLFVLAAGAIGSPALLLRSGLAESGGEPLPVGRFLMRHCNAVVAGLFRSPTNPEQVFHKQVCFTDFYEDQRAETGLATGVIQDIYTPDAGVVKRAAGRVVGALLRRPLVDRLQNLLCVAEDEPDPGNRVTVSPGSGAGGLGPVRIEHRYRPADWQRLSRLTRQAARILREAGALGTRVWRITSFSHAVGALRMGSAGDHAVLHVDGRVRGLRNLFVTDGSAFPASGGVNPSLTIAANALRIADGIVHARGGAAW